MQKSMSLEYEPASEPLHISASSSYGESTVREFIDYKTSMITLRPLVAISFDRGQTRRALSVRETEILVEQQPPQGVFVCDHAGLVINKFSF